MDDNWGPSDDMYIPSFEEAQMVLEEAGIQLTEECYDFFSMEMAPPPMDDWEDWEEDDSWMDESWDEEMWEDDADMNGDGSTGGDGSNDEPLVEQAGSDDWNDPNGEWDDTMDGEWDESMEGDMMPEDMYMEEAMGACGWDEDTFYAADEAMMDYMAAMMGMMEDYTDYMPDYDDALYLFEENGLELKEECYDFIMTIDLLAIDEYVAMEMSQMCGWDNDTMMHAEAVFWGYMDGEMGMDDFSDFYYMDFFPDFEGMMAKFDGTGV